MEKLVGKNIGPAIAVAPGNGLPEAPAVLQNPLPIAAQFAVLTVAQML
jgi:hypothetical protein